MLKLSQSFLSKEMNCNIYIFIYRKAGILVLINDTDWELEGKEDAIL